MNHFRYFPQRIFSNWQLPKYAISQGCPILGPHDRLRRLRGPNLNFGKLPLGKLQIWEVATLEILTWEVALGEMPLGDYLTTEEQLHTLLELNL